MLAAMLPARPWLPWLAFGLLLGALGPQAATFVAQRCGLALSPLALWWIAGPAALAGAIAITARCPIAARWLAFAAAALAGAAWSDARLPPPMAEARFAEIRGEVRALMWQGFGQGLIVVGSDGRCFVRAPSSPGVRLGDVVVARGLLVADARGPGLDANDMAIAIPRENGPRAFAWRALERFHDHRELATALLLGRGRPPERDAFREAGLAHVLAVSGMHLVIAAAMTAWLLRALGVPWAPRLAVGAALILGYLWLTGGTATTRAAAMTLAAIAAGAGRREPHPLGPIALATAAMVAWDPAVAFDIGFQLSFAAVLGIVTLGRDLTALRRRALPLAAWPLDRPAWRVLLAAARAAIDGVGIGIAASLATAPLVAWHFATLNPWSAPATLAATPSATAALWLGLPTLVLGGIWPDGPWAGLYYALERDLAALAVTAGACARLPGAALIVPRPPPWLMVAWPLLFAVPTLVRQRWSAAGSHTTSGAARAPCPHAVT